MDPKCVHASIFADAFDKTKFLTFMHVHHSVINCLYVENCIVQLHACRVSVHSVLRMKFTFPVSSTSLNVFSQLMHIATNH